MTKDELLRIRYKVIADYPGSIFEIGHIINTYESAMAYLTETEKGCLKDYPHLFKPLKWWEDRKVEDMPEYYKYSGNNGVFKTRFRPDGGIVMLEFSPTETVPVKMEYTLPATKEEYEAYITPQQ
jgi:hypothetical protein